MIVLERNHLWKLSPCRYSDIIHMYLVKLNSMWFFDLQCNFSPISFSSYWNSLYTLSNVFSLISLNFKFKNLNRWSLWSKLDTFSVHLSNSFLSWSVSPFLAILTDYCAYAALDTNPKAWIMSEYSVLPYWSNVNSLSLSTAVWSIPDPAIITRRGVTLSEKILNSLSIWWQEVSRGLWDILWCQDTF